MMDEEMFEKRLKGRYAPRGKSDLAAQIIRASRETGRPFWAEIQTMFILPSPAYALAASVVLGLFIGLEFMTEYDAFETEFLSLLSVDEGDWL